MAIDGEYVKRRAKKRFYRALDQLIIYAFILVVYGGAVGVDYLMFLYLWWLLGEQVREYPFVALAMDYARIGLAVLFIIGAFVHGVISTISQVKLDLALSRENGIGE